MTTLICSSPGCGAPLPGSLDGLIIVPAVFPRDLDRFEFLFIGDIQKLPCLQCGRMIDYESAALCLVPAVKQALIFLPARFADSAEKLRWDAEAQIAGLGLEGEWSFRVHADFAAFRTELGRTLRGLFAETLNSFMLTSAKASKGSDLLAWIAQHHEKLTPSFYGALYLFAAERLPGALLLRVPKPVKGRRQPPKKPSALDRKEALAAFQARISMLVDLHSISIVSRLRASHALHKLEEEVRAAFHPKVIDDRVIADLVERTLSFERDVNGPGFVRYGVHARLAAVCLLAGRENPLQRKWVGLYVSGEIVRQRKDEPEFDFTGQTVSLEFARKTLRVEDVWAQTEVVMKDILESKVDEEVIPFLEEIRGNFEAPSMDWVLNRIQIVFKDQSPSAMQNHRERLLRQIIEKPEATLFFIMHFLHSMFTNDLENVAAFALQALSGYLEIGNADFACAIASNTCAKLNWRALPQQGLEVLMFFEAAAQRRSLWPPENQTRLASFLTEKANCLRSLDRREEALKIYLECRQLVGTRFDDKDVRVNERNIGIVLRELGEIDAALAIFSALWPHTEGENRAALAMSMATTYHTLNMSERAAGLLKEGLHALPKTPDVASLRHQLLLASIGQAYAADHHEEVQSLIEEALKLDAGPRLDAAYLQAIRVLSLRESGANSDSFRALAQQAAERLRSELESRQEVPGLVRLAAYHHELALLYESMEQLAEAEAILEKFVRENDQQGGPPAWQNLFLLSKFTARHGEHGLAREHLRRAYEQAIQAVFETRAGDDPFLLMADKDNLQQDLADAYLAGHARGEVGEEDLVQIAELQHSLLLRRQILDLGRARDPDRPFKLSALLSPSGLSALLATSPGGSVVGVLHLLEGRNDIAFLFTRLRDGRPETRRLPLRLSRAEIFDIKERLTFRVKRWMPGDTEDALFGQPGFSALCDGLAAALADALPSGGHIVIAGGRVLAGLPLHAALADRYSCSYVPSIGIAAILRERRLRLPGSSAWRPRSLLDFAVWQHDESSELVACFEAASAELEEVLPTLGVPVHKCRGLTATRQQLLEEMSAPDLDCMRISCHGRASEQHLQFELLVSDGLQLPPSHPAALLSDKVERFIIGTTELLALRAAPPLMLSAACASGLSAGIQGGEQIGIQRPLFARGTLSYVAPMWPVPVLMIQPLINRILLGYIQDRTQTLGARLRAEVLSAIVAGVPRWVALSLALHGDWL